MALRYDRASGIVRRTPQGGIRVEARILRPGVLRYQSPRGERVEYRPPDETFTDAVLSGLKDAPVTDEHPDTPVSSTSHRDVARGHVSSETVRVDGQYVVADLVINDDEMISRIASRESVEVSMGYEVDFDATPGKAPDGTRYDGVQRGIAPNHVAIVPKGRSGPDVRLRLDAQGDEVCAISAGMKFERIAGALYEIDSDAWRQARQRADAEEAVAASETDELRAQLETVTAERDAALARLAELEEKFAQDEVDELMAEAKEDEVVVPEDERKDAAAIRRRLLTARAPELRIDGRDDLFVRHALEAIGARPKARRSDAARFRAASRPVDRADAAEEVVPPDEIARRRMLARLEDRSPTHDVAQVRGVK